MDAMMERTTEERLPKAFVTRMRAQLGEEGFAAYLRAMEQPPHRALRVNTCKITEESFCNLVDFTINQLDILIDIEKSDEHAENITNNIADEQDDIAKLSVNTNDNTNNQTNTEHKLAISSTSMNDITINCPNGDDIQQNPPKSADDFTNSKQHAYVFPDTVAIGRHPLHMAGLVYVQEPSAQAPAPLLSVKPGMTVLDLCAAPGGKSGQLAAAMGNTGLLMANEPVPARAAVLAENLERLGVRNAVVTCMYPDALCKKLARRCDAVLVDAPCSGEGMFRRDDRAVAEWSPEHVHACALRQRAILDAADLALRPGGALVYSTCTFSPEENEETVLAFLSAHPMYMLLGMRRLYPHTSAGEGQFMAKLQKADDADAGDAAAHKAATNRKPKPIPEWDAFCRDTFWSPPAGTPLLLPDGRVLLPPAGYFALPEGLRIVRAGVLAGELRQGRFLPAHALAMAAMETEIRRCVPLAGDALSAYFAGETVPCDPALEGFCLVTYAGYSVGWAKAVQGTLKNHLPKGLRVRG